MIGIYLSGTGNTKHCVEKLVSLLDAAAECIPLEAPHITDTLEKAVPRKQCTMCYRCISLCLQKAITLLGERVQEQCRYEKYV